MSIDDFLERFFEGYLLCDLESMEKVTVPTGKSYGGIGYPMIATTLAGIELLGGLLLPLTTTYDPDDSSNGNVCFLNFWDNYLSKKYPEYTGLGRIFRQLMRNGIAHTFVAKSGILIEKGSNQKISLNSSLSCITVDCNVFYRDFKMTYEELIKPILKDTSQTANISKITMQDRIDILTIKYVEKSQTVFASLQGQTLDKNLSITDDRKLAALSPHFASIAQSGASLPLQNALNSIHSIAASGSFFNTPQTTTLFPDDNI